MMRSTIGAAVIGALMLVGCTSTPTPTATLVPPTATPEATLAAAPRDSVLGELAGTVVIPVAGTMNAVSSSGTPDAPTRAPITIDTLLFIQSGGIAGDTMRIELRGDGTLIRGDQTLTVSADEVQKIALMLDDMHFFDVDGIFTGPNQPADAYRYSITVSTPNGDRSIITQDGMTPPELYALFTAIRNLGAPPAP